jgi:16S rRNA (adenine1518-N6/adenine1519-N6)-dimethyltransferase
MGHRAKKSLGQNFLKSQPALYAMLEAGSVSREDIILEIGPGKGALTEKLLGRAGKVIAVEKDSQLVALLQEKFSSEIKAGILTLVEDDILSIDPNKLRLKEGNYKLIANIPYNITGAIFKKFLSESIQPKAMVLLVQKEVAERVVARDGKESILSLSVKAYGDPSYIMKVGKRFFSPAPKVDSAIIAIRNISREKFTSPLLKERFFEVVRAGFAHKRKVLKKNLEAVSDKPSIHEAFVDLGLDGKIRPEDTTLATWLEISERLAH